MVSVPRDIQDWDDDDPDAGFHRNRWDFWASIVKAGTEYKAENILKPGFWDWLEDTYGIQATFNADGMVTDKFEVLDEQKYVMFLLKFR